MGRKYSSWSVELASQTIPSKNLSKWATLRKLNNNWTSSKLQHKLQAQNRETNRELNGDTKGVNSNVAATVGVVAAKTKTITEVSMSAILEHDAKEHNKWQQLAETRRQATWRKALNGWKWTAENQTHTYMQLACSKEKGQRARDRNHLRNIFAYIYLEIFTM